MIGKPQQQKIMLVPVVIWIIMTLIILLFSYWENPEFDEATDACAITEITTSKFKIKSLEKKLGEFVI